MHLGIETSNLIEFSNFSMVIHYDIEICSKTVMKLNGRAEVYHLPEYALLAYCSGN